MAQTPGRDLLKFGIDAGGNNADPSSDGPEYDNGAECHGLVFDIESAPCGCSPGHANVSKVDKFTNRPTQRLLQ